MASSDFLFTVFVIPRLIAELYLGPETWVVGGTLGSILFKLDYFIQDISTAVSILSLVAIAFDRLYAVFFPMKVGLMDGRRICIMALTGTWLLGSVLHLHHFFAFKLNDRSEHLLCKYSWSAESAQITFITYSVCLFFFPGAVLVIPQLSHGCGRQRFQGTTQKGISNELRNGTEMSYGWLLLL